MERDAARPNRGRYRGRPADPPVPTVFDPMIAKRLQQLVDMEHRVSALREELQGLVIQQWEARRQPVILPAA